MVNGAYPKNIIFFLASISPALTVAHHTKRSEQALLGQQPSGYEIAITTIGAPKYDHYKSEGSQRIKGIGNNLDLQVFFSLCSHNWRLTAAVTYRLYTVPIELSGKVFPVNLG